MDAVVKVGGSLSGDPSALRALCRHLGGWASRYRLMIVPGGGDFADAVRRHDRLYGLPNIISHKMAILAMDQYGLLLSSLTPYAFTTYSLKRACNAPGNSLPILLPSRFMFKRNPLENSWRVTSDSIAAYFASEIQAEKLIIVKDVDGIFTSDPKKHADAKLIEEVYASELEIRQHSCVDAFLPTLLKLKGLGCYVVNGRHPERIMRILEGEKAVYTRIIPA